MKKCNKCQEIKNINGFYKAKNYKDGYHSSCKMCISSSTKTYRLNNIEKHKERDRKRHLNNKEKRNKRVRDSYIKNPQARKDYQKKYNSIPANKLKINTRRNNLLKNNPIAKLSHSIRVLTYRAFKNKYIIKGSKSKKMLGCSFETLKQHIERQFTKGMTWQNQGVWHIDHKIPLATAKTEDELMVLCHYTNLQPLWGKDNKTKGSKILAIQTTLII